MTSNPKTANHKLAQNRSRVAQSIEMGSSARFFRRLVHKQLAALSLGRLTLVEGNKAYDFGDDACNSHRASIRIADPRCYRKIALEGSIGAAEAYMLGWWSSENLAVLLRLFARNLDVSDGMEKSTASVFQHSQKLWQRLKRNTRKGSRQNISSHYDLSNDFFGLFLDDSMTYSSAFFAQPNSSLAEAQVEKLDRLCRKVQLKRTDHVLEIGTGWGSFAIHAASRYGCKVTTTTVSKEQYSLAVQRVYDAGLEDKVEVLLVDYRDLQGEYDKIVSIEMIEAVGHEFLPQYFAACSKRLKPNGLMAIQAITVPDYRYEHLRRSTDFIQRYVFPGSLLPSTARMMTCVQNNTDMRMIDLEDMTDHYVATLQIWHDNFMENLDQVRELGYDETFLRMWKYYLCYCEAGFAEKNIATLQIVFAKPQHNPNPEYCNERPGTKSLEQSRS